MEQLIHAAQGVCFLYPDNYDVFVNDDGGLTFYVDSLMNTEAPIAVLTFEPNREELYQELVGQYLPGVDLTVTLLQSIEMGGELGTILDFLPGQDTNRRVLVIHGDILYNLMVARIGEEYGEVGEEAELLFNTITSSFHYIAVDPQAELIAGSGGGECPEPTEGLHQLNYAAKGVCFLYPDNYDVFVGEDGSLTLYVDSLLSVESPIAVLTIEPDQPELYQELIEQYLPGVDLAVTLLESMEIGGEIGTILDFLPGQDTNRRVLVIHEDTLYNLMVARIGEEYGAVGEEAEKLFQTITSTFTFVPVDPEATLTAGPECPEAISGTTLFTNEKDGYCLLLPEDYTIDDSLTSNNGGSETAVYVDSLMDTSHARLFITVDDAKGQTLGEISNGKATEISELMGQPANWTFGLMLDGIPADRFDQVPGQDLSRQIVMVENGRLITLTFIPDEPEAADAFAEMETLYELVMDSFSFLW
jgi:hypothetical protein